jgi:hypothetical protein
MKNLRKKTKKVIKQYYYTKNIKKYLKAAILAAKK